MHSEAGADFRLEQILGKILASRVSLRGGFHR
jgi:hypothetical protein